ncbi:hypothetical protein OSH10_04930 [Kaistia defluvii]|uniref:winged helix domain-containing protein n=1 Tax=Kaistia defluvii TaxID=410841 RepID=UPI0022561CC3|nr:hypothetical protein [Kaistia defluvii]MCX5517770.1 hypothetical protein [Kaistia defluvii]
MTNVTKLEIRVGGREGRTVKVRGRDAWALDALLRAGERGVTPIERPAPRWSHYIFKLRRAGLVVETIDEPHAGTYAGHHARYVLRSSVEVLEEERAA